VFPGTKQTSLLVPGESKRYEFRVPGGTARLLLTVNGGAARFDVTRPNGSTFSRKSAGRLQEESPAAGAWVVVVTDRRASTSAKPISASLETSLVPFPEIDLAAPTKLSVGTLIAIQGSGFSVAPKAWLEIGGRRVTLAVGKGATPEGFVARVFAIPRRVAGACTLNVVARGVATPATSVGFTIESPSIASVIPIAAPAGDSVTINGSFFGTKKGSVLIGGRRAKVTVWSDTSITVTVPAHVAAGLTTISLDNGVGVDAQVDAFTVM